jgi:hypothetical protein
VIRRVWVAIAPLVAIAALSACGGGSDATMTIHGKLTLTATVDDWYPGHDCSGEDGFSDIKPGAEVVVSDDTGKTLAIDALGVGAIGNILEECVFPFTVNNVPAGKGFYGVTVSHRGTVKFREAEVASAQLTLGHL